jgi:1-acyl-sn-glycerol-3-phosphate acyltransferase
MRVFDGSGDGTMRAARQWSRLITRFAGVRVEVVEQSALTPGQAYVFMSNHMSSLDIWSLFVALPVPVRMLAKKQLAKIPLFGWAMWAGRFIFIDRQNAAAARRSMIEAARRIRGGQPVLLFPEGTRSRDGHMGPFKKGGFRLAIEAGVPIVPVALHGTRAAMPAGSLLLRSGHVRVAIGEPIPTAGLAGEDRDQLLEQVREKIAAMLAGLDAAGQ